MQTEIELKILIKNRGIVSVKSTNFLDVTIDSNLSWKVHIGRTCSRNSCNLFIINRLSTILDKNVRRTLLVLFIPFRHMESLYGDRVRSH
jgi:hypothetical protein